METKKSNDYDLYMRKDKERKYSITEETLVKKETQETEGKDDKGRSISFQYIIKRLKVEEDEKGGWSDYFFRNGPGTYYFVSTRKLRNGEIFGATNKTTYLQSEEEAIKIGEDYIKKGLASERRKQKKLSSVPESFKEFYHQ